MENSSLGTFLSKTLPISNTSQQFARFFFSKMLKTTIFLDHLKKVQVSSKELNFSWKICHWIICFFFGKLSSLCEWMILGLFGETFTWKLPLTEPPGSALTTRGQKLESLKYSGESPEFRYLSAENPGNKGWWSDEIHSCEKAGKVCK
jgi:hypothetical protein